MVVLATSMMYPEDQLALAAGVAAVHDLVDVVALDQPLQDVELLLVARVRPELELLGEDGQRLDRPALERLVVVLGLGQLDQVADRPRDDVLVRLEIALVLLEAAAERARIVLCHGRLFGDDKLFSHVGAAG